MGTCDTLADVDLNPHRWWELIRAEATPGKATLRIYGTITSWPWLDGDMSAASLVKELEDAGDVSEIELHVNSPGGEAFEGVTIMNALRQHPARVTAHVDGIAASAASAVIMAADEVVMHPGTQIMIHDAINFAYGNADELKKVAEDLDHTSQAFAEVYAAKAGGTVAEWRDVMRAETWYNGDEAVEAGLADRVSGKSDDKAPDDVAVAAMLRRSPVAARYRYMGRAQAPTPKTPGRAVGQENRGGQPVEITDEDFAALRTKLGLGDDAEIGDVLDALEEQPPKPNEAEHPPAEEKVAAKLPAGVVAVDKDTWEQVQADAAAGRQAAVAQAQARRVALVEAAISDGKVVPKRKQWWLDQLAADEEGVTATLATLMPVFGTSEMGHDSGGPTEDLSTPDGVRKSAAYAELGRMI